MTGTTTAKTTTQVYRVFIKASREKVWEAITSPEWTQRYGYRGMTTYDLRPGGAFETHATEEMKQYGLPEVVVDGEVIESDPPRKLVHTYRFLFDEATTAEGFTTITWELEGAEIDNADAVGSTRLTIIHELEGAPTMAAMVDGAVPNAGGGWPWILSDLKTLLETGATL
jgi:uncharacterized protein YndB with AHSA1/START domain